MKRTTVTEVCLVAVRGDPPRPGRIGGPYKIVAEDPLGSAWAGAASSSRS